MFGVAASKNSPGAFQRMAAALGVACQGEPCTTLAGRVEIGGAQVFEDERLRVAVDSSLCNARQLAQELALAPGDEARLIGALYLRHGLDFLTRLQGVFALALFDKQSGRLLVATDPYGIKPVVYAEGPGGVAFAPRLKALLAVPAFAAPELDAEALVEYFNHSAIPTPKTIFRGLRKLAPGHYLLIEPGADAARVQAYYDIDYAKADSDPIDYLEQVPRMIEQSTRTQLDYELAQGRKVGCFLSGGTDSSTLVGMVKKLAGRVQTFSIGFDEPGYNELGYARIAARHFGAESHEYIVTPEDVLSAITAVGEAYDEPFGNSSVVPAYFCARLAREHGIDTLFAGDGGDEIFGGNERYAGDKVFARYRQVPALLRKGLLEPLLAAAPAVHPVIDKGKKYVRRANIPLPDRFYSYNPVMALGMTNIFAPELLRTLNGYDPVAWARRLFDGARAADDLDRLLYLDMKFTITDNDVPKVSAMAAKAGVRVAYPLLDRPLVDFAAAMPVDLKVKGTYLRYAFKKSLSGFLPQEIIDKKKHGFGLPIGVWARSHPQVSAFVRDTLLGSGCGIRGYFRDGFIEEIFQAHQQSGAAYYGDILWQLIILELWRRKFSWKGF